MTLRTDLFKTQARDETRVIAVRDTNTLPDPEIDATVIDRKHCAQGRLGIGYHFLVLTSGIIQLCRDIATVGSHSRDYDVISVAVGVVGGKDEAGKLVNTRTEEQLEAISDINEYLSRVYPGVEVSDNPKGS